MPDTHEGGCLCGTIRIAISGPLAPAAYCHCEDCRRCTGSAFNISFPVAIEHFEITAGAPKSFTKTADSGNELTRHFCGTCGSPIYTSSPVHIDRAFIKAGIMDEPDLIKPEKQSWAESGVGWADIEKTLG